jgi:hypothetical protein
MEKRLTASDLAKMAQHDSQMVRGRFNYIENKGGKFKCSQKFGKGFRLFRETFIDGHEYTIPLGVAKYINNKCRYPRLQPAIDDKGREIPNTSVEVQVQRAEFSIYEFITPDMAVPKDLVKVVKMTPVMPMPAT